MSETSFSTQLATVDEQRICLLHGYRLSNNFLGEGFDGSICSSTHYKKNFWVGEVASSEGERKRSQGMWAL